MATFGSSSWQSKSRGNNKSNSDRNFTGTSRAVENHCQRRAKDKRTRKDSNVEDVELMEDCDRQERRKKEATGQACHAFAIDSKSTRVQGYKVPGSFGRSPPRSR